MLTEKHVWKRCKKEKNHDCIQTASNLPTSKLQSNTYRSLPGDQDVFSLLFHVHVYLYVHTHNGVTTMILSLQTRCILHVLNNNVTYFQCHDVFLDRCCPSIFHHPLTENTCTVESLTGCDILYHVLLKLYQHINNKLNVQLPIRKQMTQQTSEL